MSLFRRKPKHKHDLECLRISHYNVTRSDNLYAHAVGPHSRIMWRCKTCGATWSEERAGVWRPTDFEH